MLSLCLSWLSGAGWKADDWDDGGKEKDEWDEHDDSDKDHLGDDLPAVGTDAADALGLAITHAHAGSAMARLAAAGGVGATVVGNARASYRAGRSK